MDRLIRAFIVYLLKFFFSVMLFILILHVFGYRVDFRKTVKLQAEKAGLSVKDSKPVASITQEYPDIEGLSYRDSINLTMNPALMIWKETEQPFWVGIRSNLDDQNLKNPTLFLNFGGKVDVRVDPDETGGWVEMDPDHSYYIKLHGAIQPLTGARISPLYVKFPEEGFYFVQYSIAVDNEIPTQGTFPINVRKNIVAKKAEELANE